MKLEPMKKEDLKVFDEQELWDQGKDIEEYYYDLDLEEDLLGHMFESAKDHQYQEGDIIMANNFTRTDKYSTSTVSTVVNFPHRILIITSTAGHKYTGYVMSSKVNKASVYKGGYRNSVLVDKVAGVIVSGKKPDMPCIVKVDEAVSITDDNLDDSGVYKGHVSKEFLDFIKAAGERFKSGKDMSKICWQDGGGKLLVDTETMEEN